MARPKIEIDWSVVDELCRIQCTGEEIAGVLGVDYKTLERRCKTDFSEGFGEYIKRKAQDGRSSLRRMQYRAAEGGNATMLIWLGKQYLGQTDKREDSVNHTFGPKEIGEAFDQAWSDLEDAEGSAE